MANTVFKGFKMVTSATTNFESDYLYFVRTNADKQDGYLYFNGKKYGTAKDAADELKGIIGTLPDGYSTVVAYIQSVASALTAETTAREAADTALDNKITAETAARTTADTALDNKITAETANREAADAALLGDATATTTTNATIYDVKRSVAAEALARETADTNLTNAIDAETAARETADTNLNNAITAETSARTAADSALSSRIDALEGISGTSHTHANKTVLDTITSAKTAAWDAAEQNAKNYADTQIAALDAEKSGSSHDVKVTVKEENGKLTEVAVEAPDFAALYDAKGAAATAETNAKSYADGIVATETSARTTADTALDNKITAETAARIAKDAELLGDATATTTTNATIYDVKRSVAAEALARETAITAETAARVAKDNELYSSITAETAAREAAIAALDAEKSGSSHDVKVTVKEENGKLTEVAVEAPDFAALYDVKGAAASAKTEVIGTASTSANTLGKVESIIEANEKVTASALTNLDTRVVALEGISGTSHTHDNKTVLDTITSAKTASWDAAEQNAKNYADTQIAALDATVTGSSSGITVTVTETNGKLTAATAALNISATSNNAVELKSDGIFAAIYYEDLDA